MKTLLSNTSSNYLLTGSSPRFFVSVAESNRYWATAVVADYTNRIQTVQQITDEVNPFGGMGSVSAANVDVLKLGEEIKFYSSTSVFPRYQGQYVGAGRVYKSSAASYSAARIATVGDYTSFTGVTVGQTYDSTYWTLFRAFLQFTVPTGITSCEEAYVDLTPLTNASDTDFNIYLVTGSWAIGTIGNNTYKEFSGWASGDDAYTSTVLNEPFNTGVQFSLSTQSRIRLNRAGRAAIVTASAADPPVLKLMLLSSNDYNGDAPTGNEYVKFVVSIEDETPTLELIYNTVKPDNERARIYLGYDDATTGLPASTTDMLNLWSGVVDSWSLDQRLLSLSMRHDDFKRNVKLNSNIMDTDEFPYLPEENIGKMKPIVVGNFVSTKRSFKDFVGSFIERQYEQRIEHTGYFKAYLFNKKKTAVGYSHYFPSEYVLNEVKDYGSLWGGSIKDFAIVPCIITGFAIGDYLIETGGGFFPYNITGGHYPTVGLTPIVVKTMHYSSNTGISDYANSQDNDPTNWSTISSDSDEWNAVNYDSWGVSGLLDVLAFVIEVEAPYGYGYNYLKFYHKTLKEDNSELDSGTESIAANGQKAFYLEHTALPDSKVNILITITGDNSQNPGTFQVAYPIKFRNVSIFRGFSSDIGSELFLTGQGIPDDGDGTYTGTAIALIENPSDVIRWFAMVKGGYTAEEINSSFGTARTDLSDWIFAFQFGEYQNIENLFNYEGQTGLVEELAEQCNSIVWENHEGNLCMKVFDPTDGFPTSGTDTPDDLDIFEYSGSPSDSALTRHPIFNFKLSRITIDDTYNDYVLKYAQNYATGDYTSVLTIDNGSGTADDVETNIDSDYLVTSTPEFPSAATALAELQALTSTCYNDINTTNTLVTEAWAIRDESTATKLLQRLVQWHSRRRFIVTLTTGLNAIAFELGDFINVRTDDIEDQFGTAFMNCKKWKITKITTDLVACRIEIDAIEAEIY